MKRSEWADDALEISGDFTQGDTDTIYGSTRHPNGPATTHARASAILDFGHVGPDSSVGIPTKIHGANIQLESEILQILCPKGVSACC
jgi:hypothetical protein